MATRNDGLTELLLKFASNSAELIERARAAGIIKDKATTVDVTATPTPPPAAPDLAIDAGEKTALQNIIVSQAIKIAALEAEVARLAAATVKTAD